MNEQFTDLMQSVLDRIKDPSNDLEAHTLDDCLSSLAEAHQHYLNSRD